MKVSHNRMCHGFLKIIFFVITIEVTPNHHQLTQTYVSRIFKNIFFVNMIEVTPNHHQLTQTYVSRIFFVNIILKLFQHMDF
jgi:hypothetical protein